MTLSEQIATILAKSLNAETKLAEIEKLIAAEQKDNISRGFLLAVATLLNLHDEPTIAEDVLRSDSFIDGRDVKRLGLDEYDAKALRPVFKEMKRKDALNKAGVR